MTVEPLDPSVIASYDVSAAVKRELELAVVITVVIILADVGIIVVRALVAIGATVIVLLTLGAIASQWYRWLSQVRQLELTEWALRWKSARGSGEIPLTDLTRIRPYSSSSRYAHTTDVIIEYSGRRSIRVKQVSALPDFIAVLRRVLPQLEVSFPSADL